MSDFRRRLWLATAPYPIAIALLILLGFASLDILSGLRGYVEGESLWSKAQKDAVRRLERFAQSGEETEFAAYLEEIAVPLGDRRARLELDRDEPDLGSAHAGFLAGRNNPEDIPGMIRVLRYFRHTSPIRRAISIWTEGDRGIEEIVAVAQILRLRIQPATGAASTGVDTLAGAGMARTAALQRLREVDLRLTPLEREFSKTLGDTSRKVRLVLEAGSVICAILFLAAALSLSSWIVAQHEAVERALRISEERLDLSVRGSNDGIWNWSAESGELYLSPRALEMFGHGNVQIPQDPSDLLDFVHPNERYGVEVEVYSMMRSGSALDIEFRRLDTAGTYVWTQIRGGPLTMKDGRVMRVAGSISDIGERKHAEEQRRLLAADQQRRADQAQITLLEQVQGKMGRELHDDLGQQLTGVAFLAKALEQRLGGGSATERDQTSWIVRLINETIDRVRFMSRQLSPITIDEISLGTALKRLVDDVHAIFGTRITLRVTDEEAAISGTHANQFFRIAQESISNALRHGQATEITVCMDAWDDVARLAVSDNGCGFRIGDVDQNRSLGLRSIAIRAESLEGRLRIRSTSRGTTLIVRSPDTRRSSRRRKITERNA